VLEEVPYPHGSNPRVRRWAMVALLAVVAGTSIGVGRCVLVRSAPQRAQNLFSQAEAAPDAAAAIHLYAQSIVARAEYAPPPAEELAAPRARIAPRARAEVDELLAAGRRDAAKAFVEQIRPDLQAAALEQTLSQLDRSIAQSSR
jgi:hypothetical protein